MRLAIRHGSDGHREASAQIEQTAQDGDALTCRLRVRMVADERDTIYQPWMP
jgi:hypothetical protein